MSDQFEVSGTGCSRIVHDEVASRRWHDPRCDELEEILQSDKSLTRHAR
jgi:hypothetical protein